MIVNMTNVQMKQFQYINIHNGFILDTTKFIPDINTKQIVWCVHCGPISPLPHTNNELLKIVNIKQKNSERAGGSHRCLNNIQLNLSIASRQNDLENVLVLNITHTN